MAGDPQRVVLSIQCWHSWTVAVPMFLSKPPVECGWRSRIRVLASFELTGGAPSPILQIL
jgi:hypothetical protein